MRLNAAYLADIQSHHGQTLAMPEFRVKLFHSRIPDRCGKDLRALLPRKIRNTR
jgi:hypothetical protein